MKAPSMNNFKTALIDLFVNNKTLSKHVSKWVVSNTVVTLNKNGMIMPLTGIEKQNTFAPQLNKS